MEKDNNQVWKQKHTLFKSCYSVTYIPQGCSPIANKARCMYGKKKCSGKLGASLI